ncbi:MAG: response regulator [Acidimicrobiales bacterium]
MTGRARVLLAEDNQLNRKVIRAYFGVLGIALDEAHGGFEALERIETGQYDLVLMDVQMPGMNGVEVVEAVRQLDMVQPRLVAVTAGAMDGAFDRFIAAGFDEFLPKPLSLDDLRSLLDRHRVANAA